MRYNPPPNWPTPPPGWTPEPGWEPDPAWGPEPAGWSLWIPEKFDAAGSATTFADAGPQSESLPAYANPSPEYQQPQSGSSYPPYASPGYEQPGYEQPGYEQPGFAQPFGQYFPPPRRRTGALWAALIGVVAVVGVVLAVLLISTTGVLGPSDEEQIRNTVSAMETAYNDADPTTFRAMICDDKRSNFPDDADDMRQTLMFGGEITLIVGDVYIKGDRATAQMSGEIFGESLDETWRFVLENDEWLWCD